MDICKFRAVKFNLKIKYKKCVAKLYTDHWEQYTATGIAFVIDIFIWHLTSTCKTSFQ